MMPESHRPPTSPPMFESSATGCATNTTASTREHPVGGDSRNVRSGIACQRRRSRGVAQWCVDEFLGWPLDFQVDQLGGLILRSKLSPLGR